jgi:hypothetical protein
VPYYEHLRVFGCTCYPNTTATAPHKLSPRSTRCVFLGYSTDHKGYRCLDLSTNHLIIFRHVVFDEDSFPLAASLSLTNMYFLCESGPTVSTIGTHLTTAGTSPPAPRRPAPEIPPGFMPLVANLPAPAVPPGFLPWAATMATPPTITNGPPPRTWPASPVTYIQREVRARAAGTRGGFGAAPSREEGTGVVGTRGAPEASLSPEVGVGAAGTRGALGATLCREVGAGATRTRGAPRSCPAPGCGRQSRDDTWRPRSCLESGGGSRAAATHGGPGAALSREAGTTPPPPLPRPSVRGQGVVVPVTPQIIHIG